jgi:hypothetical protein
MGTDELAPFVGKDWKLLSRSPESSGRRVTASRATRASSSKDRSFPAERSPSHILPVSRAEAPPSQRGMPGHPPCSDQRSSSFKYAGGSQLAAH